MTVAVEPTLRATAHGQPVAGRAPSASPHAVIRSWSATTPFGDLDATWAALLAGKSIDNHTQCDVAPPRALTLARAAATAVAGQGLRPDAAVVVGTSKGTIEQWLAAPPEPAGIGHVAESLGRTFRAGGPRLTVCSACASGLHALVRGAMLIQSADASQVLVVATEASVHPLFLGSFDRLGVLARPEDGCRPFDKRRGGFFMSEAAAAVVLERDKPDAPTAGANGRPSVYLDGFAIGGDATHLTGSDSQGRSLRHLLRQVIDGRPVDLVHAHGTGTAANDEIELLALEAELAGQNCRPSLYSHKAALGHSLGASGLLSVVLNCRAHLTGVVPPNARTFDPLPTSAVSISRDWVRRPVRRSIAIAAGFGGQMGVVGVRTGG
jgi:3-oxoacyl-(acyl-carrier-protein) synthase